MSSEPREKERAQEIDVKINWLMVPLKSLWKIGMLSGTLINQHSKEPQIKPDYPNSG